MTEEETKKMSERAETIPDEEAIKIYRNLSAEDKVRCNNMILCCWELSVAGRMEALRNGK